MSRAKIGTSGWNYDEWIGKFYPSKINKKKLTLCRLDL
jgi:uncharacterized protein YecE (DUF72 family)